jgi:putative glutamine amidotransferase
MSVRIGVTAPDDSTGQAYIDALQALGAIAVVLGSDGLHPDRDLENIDGLMLTGGFDVAPEHFAEEPHPQTAPAAPARDLYELALARAAWTCDMPVLAICRGMQLVNVALGGTLIQHVPDIAEGTVDHQSGNDLCERHVVRIDSDSHLGAIIGADRVLTNSTHHQAVGTLAPGLRVSAHTGDGIVEAIEAAVPRAFWIGVQWHPEETFAKGDLPSVRIFEAFMRAVVATNAYPLRASLRILPQEQLD